MSVYQLPEVLDHLAAVRTAEDLLQRRGHDLRVDGFYLQRVSAQGLEVLLAAQRQWQEDGFSIKFTHFSPEVCEGIGRLGLAKLLELEV